MLTYIINQLQEVVQKVSERQFLNSLEPLTQFVLACKNLQDPKPTIHAYQLLGSLLANLSYYGEAYSIFEIAKDLANESQNLAQELVCFDCMGQIMFELNDFAKAKVLFKKMLQLAWLIRSTDAEFRAYNEIGKAYFYLGHIEKSFDYQSKALHGDLEELDSK